jgi:hypothetical protein
VPSLYSREDCDSTPASPSSPSLLLTALPQPLFKYNPHYAWMAPPDVLTGRDASEPELARLWRIVRDERVSGHALRKVESKRVTPEPVNGVNGLGFLVAKVNAPDGDFVAVLVLVGLRAGGGEFVFKRRSVAETSRGSGFASRNVRDRPP